VAGVVAAAGSSEGLEQGDQEDQKFSSCLWQVPTDLLPHQQEVVVEGYE